MTNEWQCRHFDGFSLMHCCLFL